MEASAKALGTDRLSVADRLALIDEIRESLVDGADSLEIHPGRGKAIVTEETIEGRLAAVEEAVEELRRTVEVRPVDPKWLDRFVGAFEDEPAFDEVIRLGREYRMADRPT